MAQLSDEVTAFGGRLMRCEEALARIGQGIDGIAGRTRVRLDRAHGRVLCKDIRATRDVPPHDNAAVDGYAFSFDDVCRDTHSGPHIDLRVVADIRAGSRWSGRIGPGQAAQIFTGAPMPDGADTVMMQEDCSLNGSIVTLRPGITRGANRRFKGEDIRHGNVILPRGQRLRPQDIGLAASIGKNSLPVWERLRGVVFSCGDELADRNPKDGSVYDSNRPMLVALLRELGVAVKDGGILPDDPAAIRDRLIKATASCDMILTSGGMSTGKGDHIRSVIQDIGQIDFWRLAIRPGRPLAMGRIDKTAFVGVPGNPVAAMVTFLVFVRPLLDILHHREPRRRIAYPIPAAFTYRKKVGRREWLRAILQHDEDGMCLTRFDKSGAGILSSLTAADGLIEVAEDIAGIRPGDMVSFLPFRELLW